jgi:hypothetical protein
MPVTTKIIFRPGTRQIWIGLEGESGGQGAGGAGGAGGTSSSAAGSASASDDKKPLEFSPEQQAFLEAKMNESFSKGAAKVEKALQAKIDVLESEIAKLSKKPGEKPKKGDGDDERTYSRKDLDQVHAERDKEWDERLKASDKKAEEAQAREKDLLIKERSAAIIAAAAKHKAVDPEEVAQLLGAKIGHDDDGNLIVLNDSGMGGRLGKDGQPLTIDIFVKDWLDARPHHKTGSGNPGAGSGSRNAAPGTPGAPPTTFGEANLALAKHLAGAK